MVIQNANEHFARARMMNRYQHDQQDVLACVLWERCYDPRMTWRFAELARTNYELMSEAYLNHVFG